ncbi:MAG TPA: ankyrin repeat domain-containing protein [Dokdonella sp.]
MKELPTRPNLGHLKKQAKDLLAACRRFDRTALARMRTSLPAAAGRSDEAIAAMDLRLHDAQSCLARDYGFPSWTLLKDYVDAKAMPSEGDEALLRRWMTWTFGAGYHNAKPALSARMLGEHPRLVADLPALACAVGDVARVRVTIAHDAAWARTRGTPDLPSPLQCACFSALIGLPAFAQGIRDCAALLLAAGADVGDPLIDPAFPNEPLSVLYAAAGRNHDAALTRLLLQAGANPDDGESLYHATEVADPECVRLLLEAGARVTGSNALFRSLDFEHPRTTRLLLAHGGDANEAGPLGSPLTHAIRRRRSLQVVRLLLDAGADPASRNAMGVGAYRLALRMGLSETAGLLREHGAPVGGDDAAETFIAACARADRAAAFAVLAQHPGLIGAMSVEQLHVLPDLAAEGCDDAVRIMVEAGWPIAVRGGDIRGSALNHAVFRGDSVLAGFLLAHGASYDERHTYNDNVYGTLGFASTAVTNPQGDWLGCAKALIESGAPIPGVDYAFAEDVAQYFAGLRSAAGG